MAGNNNIISVYAPLAGKVIPISEVDDPVFKKLRDYCLF